MCILGCRCVACSPETRLTLGCLGLRRLQAGPAAASTHTTPKTMSVHPQVKCRDTYTHVLEHFSHIIQQCTREDHERLNHNSLEHQRHHACGCPSENKSLRELHSKHQPHATHDASKAQGCQVDQPQRASTLAPKRSVVVQFTAAAKSIAGTSAVPAEERRLLVQRNTTRCGM